MPKGGQAETSSVRRRRDDGKDYGSVPRARAQTRSTAGRFGQADGGPDPDAGWPETRRSRGAARSKVAESQKDMTSKFPNIVVQNT